MKWLILERLEVYKKRFSSLALKCDVEFQSSTESD